MVFGAVVVAIWGYLLLGRGGFWRIHDDPPEGSAPAPAPPVVVVVPARNEADVVGCAVASLAAQKYAGQLRIVLVDDGSTDGTAAVARAGGGPSLKVIEGAPLPGGWTGKLWAVAQGVERAGSPNYLLLTDADIVHPPENVELLIARAEAAGYDLVSYMATLHCETPAEQALIPAFVFFFFMLYPPRWIRARNKRTAGAAGGCMLIRRTSLERIGGIARIRDALIDDCALARAVKDSGGRVWLGVQGGTRSIREYRTFGEIGRMISRTAFTQLNHSPLLLAGSVAGLTVTFLAPPVLALRRSPGGIAAWLMMSIAYIPVLRYYRRPAWQAPLLPLVALFYMGATVHSAIAYWRGAGGIWKGRAQAL
jgi:hopene-associated glycosyltransferase HpnB